MRWSRDQRLNVLPNPLESGCRSGEWCGAILGFNLGLFRFSCSAPAPPPVKSIKVLLFDGMAELRADRQQ